MAKHPDLPERSPAVDAELGVLKSDPAELHDPGQLLSSLEARLAQEERGVVAWLRSRPSRTRLALGAAVAAVPVVDALVDLSLRPGQGALHPAHALTFAMAPLLLYALWLGLRSHSRPALGARQLFGVLLLSLAALLLIDVWPAPVAAAELARSGGTVLGCAGVGLLFALPVYAWLRLLDRGDNPHGPVLALGAGISANLALNLHCSGHGPLHDILGHFAVVVVLLGLHAVLGRRAVSARRV